MAWSSGEPPRDDDELGGDARLRLLIGIGRVPDIVRCVRVSSVLEEKI